MNVYRNLDEVVDHLLARPEAEVAPKLVVEAQHGPRESAPLARRGAQQVTQTSPDGAAGAENSAPVPSLRPRPAVPSGAAGPAPRDEEQEKANHAAFMARQRFRW